MQRQRGKYLNTLGRLEERRIKTEYQRAGVRLQLRARMFGGVCRMALRIDRIHKVICEKKEHTQRQMLLILLATHY